VGRRLGLAAAAAAAAALVGLVASGAFNGSTHAPLAPALALDAPAGPSLTITADPIGLSIEYPLLERDLGGGRCPPASFVAAVAGLGTPTLRIGGDSQDEVAPAGTAPPATRTAPPAPRNGGFRGVSDLDVKLWTQLGCLERETGIDVVVGLNLASGEPAWGAELAAQARAAIPAARLSFELGNEPDIYGLRVRWWNGRALVSTAMPWSTYLARARQLAARLGPGAAIEGPDLASGRWVAAVPALARTLHLRTIDAHFYPLDGCRDPAAVTTANLLSRGIQSKLDERVRLARDARAAGLEAVISEANSVSCGGVAGVSDEPATAVWGVRTVITALRDGFASVRFHSSGGPYDPFVVTAGGVVARPLYVGLRALAGLLAPGERLRAIPGAGALDAVALGRPGGETQTTLLSNYAATPRWVALEAGGSPARVLAVIARAPTLERWRVAASGGRVRVELPANSVVAISIGGAQPGSST
jgi:hypothetical protein